MAKTRASEELLAAPLPRMVQDLGMAVASANKALREATKGDMSYTIPEAEIDIKVAISIDSLAKTEVEGGLALQAFNVNASYAKTFGYKEEASSHIKLKIQAVPNSAGADAPNAGG